MNYQTTSILIGAILLTACPDDTGGTEADNATTIASTSGVDDSASTGEESATLVVTTSGSPDTTGDESTTSGEAVECGVPATFCPRRKDNWCDDAAESCALAGIDLSAQGGTNYCAAVAEMCEAGESACAICFYIANTCQQLPAGIECETVKAECLCRAAAHGLPVDG